MPKGGNHGARLEPRSPGPLDLRLFLQEESDLTHMQVRRAQFMQDPEVAGVWAVNIERKGNSPARQLLVYTNRDPWDFEEVTFGGWPPGVLHDKFDIENWSVM